MNLDKVRTLITTFVQAHRPGMAMGLNEFNSILATANLLHFKRKLGLPEDYQPGQYIARQGAEASTKNIIDLQKFIVSRGVETSPVIFSNGIANAPSDFYYPLAAMHTHYAGEAGLIERKFDFVSEYDWAEFISNSIKLPDLFFPIIKISNGKLYIYPRTISVVRIDYYRQPRTPVYSTVIENGVNVYDEATSVQLEWDDINTVDIIILALSLLSVPVSREDILQYSEVKKQQGV